MQNTESALFFGGVVLLAMAAVLQNGIEAGMPIALTIAGLACILFATLSVLLRV